MEKYTEEEVNQIRTFERAMWLRDLEVGKPLTEKQFDAINHFLGKLIVEAKAVPIQKMSIHFDKSGQAYSLDDGGLVESVNGQEVNRPLEGSCK